MLACPFSAAAFEFQIHSSLNSRPPLISSFQNVFPGENNNSPCNNAYNRLRLSTNTNQLALDPSTLPLRTIRANRPLPLENVPLSKERTRRQQQLGFLRKRSRLSRSHQTKRPGDKRIYPLLLARMQEAIRYIDNRR